MPQLDFNLLFNNFVLVLLFFIFFYLFLTFFFLRRLFSIILYRVLFEQRNIALYTEVEGVRGLFNRQYVDVLKKILRNLQSLNV